VPTTSPLNELRVFVGIDWGGSHHQLCVVDDAGARRRQVRLAHDVAGLAQLDQELGQFGTRLPVAVERAEGLLVEHLHARGQVVYPVSPRIAARARERYRVASSKDDVFDAFVLADTLRHEHAHWRPLPACSPLLAELRALTRDRDRLLATQQRTEAQLRAILEAYHPAVARLFSSIDRQVTLAFIADYPTPQAAAVVGEQRMARFLARTRYTGRVKPEVLVERLRANLLTGAPGTVAGKATPHWSSPSCWGCSTSNWPTTTTPSPWPSHATPTRPSSPASPASDRSGPRCCWPRSAKTAPTTPWSRSCWPRPAWPR
jgi:transposase